MKITPKPVPFSEQPEQARDVVGFGKWAQSSRTVSFIIFLLGWFTIPAEVLLRRDFGQRWFTVVNFYAGLFLLGIFAGLQYLLNAVWQTVLDLLQSLLQNFFPLQNKDSDPVFDELVDRGMLIVLMLYLLMGAHHLFKIWWRRHTNTGLHSFDDGTSRLERLGGLLMKVINVLAIPLVYLYSFTIPRKQRRGMKRPRLINDRTAFSNTVLEPVLLLVLAIELHRHRKPVALCVGGVAGDPCQL